VPKQDSTSVDTEVIVRASERLVDAVTHDDTASGGLLSRQTIRVADELRIALLRWRKRGRG
jgi:hypothetical protein